MRDSLNNSSSAHTPGERSEIKQVDDYIEDSYRHSVTEQLPKVKFTNVSRKNRWELKRVTGLPEIRMKRKTKGHGSETHSSRRSFNTNKY
jgi:hypothetical protein